MTYFRTNLLTILLTFILIGCSAQVEDKNSGLSATERIELAQDRDEEALEVQSITIESQNDNKEDLSANANIVSRDYALKVCLKDRKMIKGLGNKNVFINGEMMKTDTTGCIKWSHEITIDYTEENKCRVFEKEIRFSYNRVKHLRYSIDSVTNQISDLSLSNGCVRKKALTKASTKVEPLILKDMRLSYNKNLTVMRSDLKLVKHATKFETCLDVKMTGKPLSNAKIKFTATNLETKEVSTVEHNELKTGYNGCFATDFVSSYEQYLYSHWMEVDIKIEVLTGPLKGATVNRSAFINPWEDGFKQYGIGEVGRAPQEIDVKNKYARFHLDGAMYINIGNDTKKMKVNDYLGLSISKTYQIVLNPYINRGHRYTQGKYPINRIVNDGQFKLSMILLAPKDGDMEINKSNFDNFEFITGVEKIVTVKNGIINAVLNIPFKMTDLPRLAVRTISVLKMEPIGDSNLQPTIVTGFFKARIAWIRTNVIQSEDLNVPDYINKEWQAGKKDASELKTADVDKLCSTEKKVSAAGCLKGMTEVQGATFDAKTFAYKGFIDSMFGKLNTQTIKMNSSFTEKVITPQEIFVNHVKKKFPKIKTLSTYSAARTLGIKINTDDFDTLLPENRTLNGLTDNMAEELCRYGFHKNGAYKRTFGFKHKISYKRCLLSPNKFFGIKSVRHVEEVKGIDNSYATGFVINLGEGYQVNAGEVDALTEATTASIGGDVGGKLPIPGLTLGLKAGVSKSLSKSHSKSDGFSKAESIGTSKTIGVEKFVMDVDANFKRCMVVVSKDFLDVGLASKRAALTITGSGMSYIPTRKQTQAEKEFYAPQSNLDVQLYICDRATIAETFTESWYFLQSNVESSLGRDEDGVQERRLLKVIRGADTYKELHKALQDLATKSLVLDNIGYETPEDLLIQNWGHLIGTKMTDAEARIFLVKNVEGAFPGTIEGQGATRMAK